MIIILIYFSYNKEDILCTADWGKKLSYYNKNGSEVIHYIENSFID